MTFCKASATFPASERHRPRLVPYLGEQSHACVNDLPNVAGWQRSGKDWTCEPYIAIVQCPTKYELRYHATQNGKIEKGDITFAARRQC